MADNRPEHLIRIVDEHWMIYLRPIFFSSIVLIAGLLSLVFSFLTVFHSGWMYLSSYIFGVACLLLSFHGLFVILMSESLSQIVITSKRVLHFSNSIPFGEGIAEASFEKMKSVEVEKHGLLQSVLNYGSLNFERGKMIIHFVPHPNSVARDIYQAMGML